MVSLLKFFKVKCYRLETGISSDIKDRIKYL